MLKRIKYNRRNFLRNGVMALGGSKLAMIGLTNAMFTDNNKKQAMNSRYNDGRSIGPIKQINAGLLNVGYAEAGPTNGSSVILLHGWPYDIYTYAEVMTLLAGKGYRVIVPYLRGYGSTTFLSNETFRNGQQSALAL